MLSLSLSLCLYVCLCLYVHLSFSRFMCLCLSVSLCLCRSAAHCTSIRLSALCVSLSLTLWPSLISPLRPSAYTSLFHSFFLYPPLSLSLSFSFRVSASNFLTTLQRCRWACVSWTATFLDCRHGQTSSTVSSFSSALAGDRYRRSS